MEFTKEMQDELMKTIIGKPVYCEYDGYSIKKDDGSFIGVDLANGKSTTVYGHYTKDGVLIVDKIEFGDDE